MNTEQPLAAAPVRRITSIDALRGLVIFTMIYVNDIAGADSRIVPAWMRHFPGRASGMTFVDLVFPAFLFLVGMSVPFALSTRLARGEPAWKCFLHVALRTLSLLFIGIMMVNGWPDAGKMGWSPALWSVLMYLAAILAFSSLSLPHRARMSRLLTLVLRVLGFTTLIFLAFAFRGKDDQRIITLAPFSIRTQWYGILGLIGWAYLVAALVFLVFRIRRTPVLACVVLLFCLYPADRAGIFDGFWLSRVVGIGGTLGSQGAIAVAGMLLASILLSSDLSTTRARTEFTLLFIAGCSAGALLLHGLYGINKNSATPSWCLWACAITGALWLVFYFLADVRPQGLSAKLVRPFAIAGSNVLLAYLISDVYWALFSLLGLGDWYSRLAEPDLAHAMGRSIGLAVVILALTAGLNRLGFRLKL